MAEVLPGAVVQESRRAVPEASFASGETIGVSQIAEAQRGLMRRTRQMPTVINVLDIARQQEDLIPFEDVLHTLTVLSDITEGTEVSEGAGGLRPLREAVLYDAPHSRWSDAKGRGFKPIAEALYIAGGACQPWHTIRDDCRKTMEKPGEKTGLVVMAANFGGKPFYFIERPVLAGVGWAATRQLQIISEDHPGLLAAVNEYSLEEYRQASVVLDAMGATTNEKHKVLAIANRLLAPKQANLQALLQNVRDQYPAGQSRLGYAQRLLRTAGFGGLVMALDRVSR
jgi:hypothetical protein